ncbi:MAG: hypothetical protein FJ147_03850 [Deltaproteobacteria bacterium]|nr:hypothetical protein [Deltaproteobacteria bacterium]
MKSRKNYVTTAPLGISFLLTSGCATTWTPGNHPHTLAWAPGTTTLDIRPAPQGQDFPHPAPWHSAKSRLPLENVLVWHAPLF